MTGQGDYAEHSIIRRKTSVRAPIVGLDPSARYDLRVRVGKNGGAVSDGRALEGSSSSFETRSSALATEPTNFAANVTGTAVTISWTQQSAGASATSQGYVIFEDGDGYNPAEDFIAIATSATSINVGRGSLKENTLYRIIIRNVTTGAASNTTYVGGSFMTGSDD